MRILDHLDVARRERRVDLALAIGDDRIMKTMGRKPWPEKFNHGTAEQRAKSFTAGFKTGDARKVRLQKFFTVSFDAHTGELDDALFE